ncbi:hypothetical protein [Metapseudomonas otitidis]|uniref:hypothetical protein n=1 Tax=Metapseudomonas otitidis TaxID=319939 RepID=UPI001F24ADFD|nr:hypothetical protein [Pseudomonas otitidis]
MSDVKRCKHGRNFCLECHDEKDAAAALLVECEQLRKERNKLRAELEAIRGQQPVAWRAKCNTGFVLELCLPDADDDRATLDWEPLYALPPQQPDAVSVPRELLESHLQQVGEYSWDPDSVGMLRALLSTKNAEEGE